MDILKRIRDLTTDLGIYQHAKIKKPDPKFGYALEDQSRALILAYKLNDEKLKKIYLDFIIRAKRKDGLLYHFCYENNDGYIFKNEENNSKPNLQEAYGIALWALLTVQNKSYHYNNNIFKNDQDNNGKNNANNSENNKINKEIKKIIDSLIKDAYSWTSPRAMASALLGLLNIKNPIELENKFIQKLIELFHKTHTKDWVWFENYLVYANAILPWALWKAYVIRKYKNCLEVAQKTTEFLINTCQENKIPSPIGNKGWYFKDKSKALYDQQPIDASYMVCCLDYAYQATSDKKYLKIAKEWYEWFWGNNLNKIPLIDNEFACYDSLTPKGVNLNQGAESNICFLFAHLSANKLKIL